MKTARILLAIAGLSAAMATRGVVAAELPERWQLNMTQGVTETAQRAYDMHMMILWICVVIGAIVFGAMAYAIVKFRKSKGAVADASFTHSTRLEILWTVVPTLILVVMAVPATLKTIDAHDTRGHEMTVKIIGHQWLWSYEYVGTGVRFTSRLSRESDRLRQSGIVPNMDEHGTYLLDVDRPLVLPTNTRIRFILTADDVIHAWWVPALGWKSDAIPGIINEQWTEILEPGIFRGQCAELCGKDHAFMPIVVKAVPPEEFEAWLAARKTETPADRTSLQGAVVAAPQG